MKPKMSANEAVNRLMALSEQHPCISEAVAIIMREQFKEGFLTAFRELFDHADEVAERAYRIWREDK